MKEPTRISICYIDDDANELRQISELLTNTLLLDVRSFTPSAWLSIDAPRRSQYDLFLVDYELSKATSDSGPIAHTGNLLAAYIREIAGEYPVVLLTKTSLIEPATRGEHLANYPLLDDILYKDHLSTATSTKEIANRLRELALGYSKIRAMAESERNWDGILYLLQARAQEREWLALANPPLYPSSSGALWRVSSLAIWIIQVLLEYPGIIL